MRLAYHSATVYWHAPLRPFEVEHEPMAEVMSNGSVPWSVVQRVAGGAAAVPLTIVFLTLGAAVLMGRSLLDAARWTRRTSASRAGRRLRQTSMKDAPDA